MNRRDFQTFELVQYEAKVPFRIHNVTRSLIQDHGGNVQNVLEHWHSELEIAYTYCGHARHYIDGCVQEAYPGALFVTNSESIHKVLSDADVEQELIATILMLNDEFVRELVPNLKEMYFLPDTKCGSPEIEALMRELAEYADGKKGIRPYEELRLIGKVYELMSVLCQSALVVRESVLPVNSQKNLERLRGVMQYVSENYTEPMIQSEVAQRFYFTREYFSRFFRKNTGMTFKEYVSRYRVNAAREALLHTDQTILEIAVNTGFSDARGLIQAFKQVYGTTPLQYRKSTLG